MTAVDKIFLAKFAASNLQSTALPGSSLSKVLNWSGKTFKGVTKRPVLPQGNATSGMQTKPMPKLL